MWIITQTNQDNNENQEGTTSQIGPLVDAKTHNP